MKIGVKPVDVDVVVDRHLAVGAVGDQRQDDVQGGLPWVGEKKVPGRLIVRVSVSAADGALKRIEHAEAGEARRL